MAWWAGENLIQPNGPRSGQPFEVTPRQRRFWLWWYAVDENGRWLYHHGVRRLAKGSGKSPFAAAQALAEFCGPVRLDHIDTSRRDKRLARWGWTVPKTVDMPWVQIAATAESQTANTMRMVRAFAAKGSKLVTRYQLDPGKTKYYKLPEGTLEVITSSATAAEGAEASFIVGDETEHWRPANGGVELSAVLEDNLAKSGSRMLETSNAWVPGHESVAEATWAAFVAQEEGRLVPEAGRILYDAVLASPGVDLADRPAVFAELERIYADCPWIDLHAIMGRIYNIRSRPADSRRKYLNRPSVNDDAWLDPPDLWDAMAGPDLPVRLNDGDEIVAFFDGSKSRDATALVGCHVESGDVFTIGVWERPLGPDGEGWTVPVSEVDAAVEWMFERWRPVAFWGDVREWESWVQTTWPERYKDRLILWAVPVGKEPGPVAWDMRTHTLDFTKAAETVHAEIIERAFRHDGSAVLARHVTNMRSAPNRWGTSVRKASPDSPDKIDAGVCAIGARMLRRRLLASKEWAERDQKSTGKRPGRARAWGW